jgi:hypothetical protein
LRARQLIFSLINEQLLKSVYAWAYPSRGEALSVRHTLQETYGVVHFVLYHKLHAPASALQLPAVVGEKLRFMQKKGQAHAVVVQHSPDVVRCAVSREGELFTLHRRLVIVYFALRVRLHNLLGFGGIA